MAGTLYVVATPLGNLGDLSPRAAEVLRSVPVVAAEDTRRTRVLLAHLGATPRLVSVHAHSDPRRLAAILATLRGGRDVALVTDAGTPGISDPGPELVARVRAAGLAVVPLPGPSAVAAALSAAGLPADRYLFLGFLPRRGAERERLLGVAAESEWTVVLFESPPRLAALLDDLARVAGGDRQAVVARELTKLHEEIRAGTLGELAAHYRGGRVRGECTVLVAGRGAVRAAKRSGGDAARTLARRLLAEGHSRRDVIRELARHLALSRNEAYRVVTSLS
jgi:16S rRNA (cytidine1402-2'-O)-methyltransferase